MEEKNTPLTEAVFYILLAVREPNHGYGITQEIQKLTNDRVNLSAGTLYGALQTLQKKGWIEIYSEDAGSRRKKEYVITEEGKLVFRKEQIRLKELLQNSLSMKD